MIWVREISAKSFKFGCVIIIVFMKRIERKQTGKTRSWQIIN
jgi:hypothetical protein